MEEPTLLILGAGWTATFLIPLLKSRNIPFAATTTSGHSVAGTPTIPFKFDPSAPEHETRSAIGSLPRARYILITFPLTGAGPSKLLVRCYEETHRPSTSSVTDAADGLNLQYRFIQLGSTGIWQQALERNSPATPPTTAATPAATTSSNPWITRHSPYARENPRAVAEDELLALGGCVLNLAGLWGGARQPRNWAGRVAASKEAVRRKDSLHLVHGADVARGVGALVAGEGSEIAWQKHGRGQRWMVTDGFVYDWWALLAGWAGGQDNDPNEQDQDQEEQAPIEQARWVFELMREDGVRALPRSMEVLGRCYDSREFWEAFGLVPLRARV